MSKNCILVKDNSKLELHVYVLGYYPMGESILILIWDDESKKAIRTILIDCYENASRNVMIKILKNYQVDNYKIDYIIWTHPDYDHSVGFSIIMESFASSNTKCFLPEGFSKMRVLRKNKEVIKSWYGISRIFSRKKYHIEHVSNSTERAYPTSYAFTTFRDGYSDDINFSIEILSPNSGVVCRKTLINKSYKDNDISISCLIRFGLCNLYFGGDAENQAIRLIEPECFKDLDFIKIPHHASETSNILPQIIEDINALSDERKLIAVTTSFKSNDIQLPRTDVLNLYRKCSSYILTTEDEQHAASYGAWKFSYYARSLKSMDKFGDASIWFQQ